MKQYRYYNSDSISNIVLGWQNCHNIIIIHFQFNYYCLKGQYSFKYFDDKQKTWFKMWFFLVRRLRFSQPIQVEKNILPNNQNFKFIRFLFLLKYNPQCHWQVKKPSENALVDPKRKTVFSFLSWKRNFFYGI